MPFRHKTIEGKNILLVPFSIVHIEGLKKIAIDKRIWDYLPYKVYSDEDFEKYINSISDRIDRGTQLYFTIIGKHTSEILGSTSFLNIDETNKRLEIGGTWLASKVWGTKVNLEVKYLLLDFCFCDFDMERIEFRTWESNLRSQNAIEKIGGVKEGVLRSDKINEDGTFRNTILYSIVRPKWHELKNKLVSELNNSWK